jgi:nucleoside-diphosphate-sugar epimerase
MRLLIAYVRRRVDQRFGLAFLGPNEARIVFDFLAAIGGSAGAQLYWRFFGPVAGFGFGWQVWLFPPAFLVSSAALGMYSRLRRSRIRTKCAALSAALILSGAVLLATGAPPGLAVLALALTAGPVLIARVLLGLPHSRHRNLASLAVNRRGPVVVVGGAGYIGSLVVELLLEAGQSVRVLDNLMYTRAPLESFLANPHFELIEGDVTDITKLTRAVRGASAVIHLSGLVGDPACAVDPEFTRHANIVATRMAKDVAQSLGVYRFIFASSCSVYGVSEEEVTETADLHPVSLYAQTKIDSERELLSACRDDFFVTVLRFATVFGHSRRPRFDLVGNLFTAQAMTEGRITVTGPRQRRPFIHVRDLARALVKVLQAEPALVQGQIYNVGDSRLNMTILQLAELVQRVAPKEKAVTISVQEDVGDRRNYAVCFDKIRSQLGFQASILIEDGIREMVENFALGRYKHYRDPAYSNVAITQSAVEDFRDPSAAAHLYAPLKL